MDNFEGFTDEDIRRLSDKDLDKKRNVTPSVSKNVQRHRNRLTQKNVTRERILKNHLYSAQNSAALEIPREARLHIHKIPEEKEEETAAMTGESEEKLLKPRTASVQTSNKLNVEATTEKKYERTPNDQPHGEGLSEQVVPHFLCAESNDKALEEFEARQRLMEEQNKQRKEILKKAIADRARRTHEESKRLNEIEGELKKLDLLLSNDVAILRNHIESASLEFSEAQKRYDKAEKEFLDAKLDMFNKKEKKELLTSHLCTIIEQNEMRKAKKLSDLMMKLEIGCKSLLMPSHITVDMKTEEDEASSNKDKPLDS